MESDLSSSSFSIDNILKPDKCDSTQEPRSADRALTLAERLAGEPRKVLSLTPPCSVMKEKISFN